MARNIAIWEPLMLQVSRDTGRPVSQQSSGRLDERLHPRIHLLANQLVLHRTTENAERARDLTFNIRSQQRRDRKLPGARKGAKQCPLLTSHHPTPTASPGAVCRNVGNISDTRSLPGRNTSWLEIECRPQRWTLAAAACF
jgi:hypothetical protein